MITKENLVRVPWRLALAIKQRLINLRRVLCRVSAPSYIGIKMIESLQSLVRNICSSRTVRAQRKICSTTYRSCPVCGIGYLRCIPVVRWNDFWTIHTRILHICRWRTIWQIPFHTHVCPSWIIIIGRHIIEMWTVIWLGRKNKSMSFVSTIIYSKLFNQMFDDIFKQQRR